MNNELGEIREGIYLHYKGNKYRVICEASHSETEETMVVYQCLYGDFSMWVRPKAMFMETVELDGEQVPRFRFLASVE